MQLLIDSFSKKHCHSTKLFTMAGTIKKKEFNLAFVMFWPLLKSLHFPSTELSICEFCMNHTGILGSIIALALQHTPVSPKGNLVFSRYISLY